MRSIDIDENEEDGLRAFIMTLRPRRSADPRVAYMLCGTLGLIWMGAGIMLTVMGGWPVFGFFGAEFIFIAVMVRIFMRRTQVMETVEINAQDVRVTRRELAVETTREFQTYWAQADFSGSPTQNAALEIRSHGNAVEIGTFLSAAEKHRTAATLNDALHRHKTAVQTTQA